MLTNAKVIGNKMFGYGMEDATPTTLKDVQFKIFSIVWAIATLFHMAHSNLFTAHFHYVLLTLSAIYVIFRPSLAGFLALISLQLVDVFFTMPATSNHWLFTAFVNITVIQALVYIVIKNKTLHVRGDQLYDTFAPVVRIELIILYFYAVFHKINSGFFTPESSCATDLLKAQHIDSIIPLSPAIFAANAYFTLIVEAAIPIFFCFRKTRNWGVLIGLVFHCILSYSSHNAFYDFSSMAFAAYFLFISSGFSSMLLGFRTKVRNLASLIISQERVLRKLVLLISFWLVGMIAILVITKKLPEAHTFYLHIFWTGYSLLYIYLFGWFMLSRSVEVQSKTAFINFSLPHKSFLILPVIVFLNGLSPYLGLKTENSYAMFSNLRTEGNISNHYIIPASFQIFDFQKDIVEIISSSDTTLQARAEENKMMVFFAFKNYVAQVRPERVEYIRNGQRQTFILSEATASNELLNKNSVLKKLFNFRVISKTDPQPCSH
jgi:hypothetical protein